MPIIGEHGVLMSVIDDACPVVTFRDHHHRIARLLAEGVSPAEIARIVGLSVARIWWLKQETQFRALIEHYKQKIADPKDDYADIYTRAEQLRVNAIDLLNERYEAAPHTITHAMALNDLQRTNEMLEEKVTRTLNLTGDLADMSLADLVHARRKRAETLRLEAQACLPGELGKKDALSPGPEHQSAAPVPAPKTNGHRDA
jgi:hypothetical protein